MNPDHRYFVRLSTLASLDQLTEAETVELRAHLEFCFACRAHLAEMTELNTQLSFLCVTARDAGRASERRREHFAARAIREGVPLSPRLSPLTGPGSGLASAVLLGLMVVAAFVKIGPILIAAGPMAAAGAAEGSRVSVAPNDRKSLSPDICGHRRSSAVGKAGVVNRRRRSREIGGISSAAVNLAATGKSRRSGFLIEDELSLLPQSRPRPDGLQAASLAYLPPRSVFGSDFGLAADNTQRLLAECERCAFTPAGLRSSLRFAAAGQFSAATPIQGAYRTTGKPEFSFDSTSFHLHVFD